MFRLESAPVLGPLVTADGNSGALVVFEGRVRDQNEGKRVIRLEYEAFAELALKEGTNILEEARTRFHIINAMCVHRTGMLEIGDVAIRAEVAAAHRREAFDACMFIVDETKRRVPIWKKEHYADGATEWIANQQTPREAEYYDRQVRLPEVGQDGQKKLFEARVLVVGAGGLGCPALSYLAAAGIGTIGICEPDNLESGNLHRQVLYSIRDIGASKVTLAAEALLRLNPFIKVNQHPEALTTANVQALCAGYDLILDCTDSLATKFVLSDAAIALGKELIVAAIYQYEGQLFTVAPGGPCLRCVWPFQPPSSCVGSCAEVGVLGVVPGVLGALQANEAVKLILQIAEPSRMLTLIDLIQMDIKRITVAKNPDCPACGSGGIPIGPWWEIFADSPNDLSGFTLVDVREKDELSQEPLPIRADAWAPMSSTPPEEILALSDGPILLICRSGARTARMAMAFEETGCHRVYSLGGGRNELIKNPAFNP